MKRVCLILALALAIGSSSVTQRGNPFSAPQAEAGVAFFGLYFWSEGYREGVANWCGKSTEDTSWQPLKFVFFAVTCVVAFAFGDEDQNASIATEWLSADHPAITKGITTSGGAFVKYSAKARAFHNDHLDDFIDLAEEVRDDIDDYRVKEDGATITEITEDFHKIISKRVKDIEKQKEFDTPAGREALANFYQLQFNVTPKNSKKESSKE